MPRGTITGRWRRQLPNVMLDVGAGPLFAQVVAPPTSGCCPDRTAGYGATIETALMFRGYAGVTAGADLLHGAGRTSGALHLGARVGSYGTLVLAGTVTALTLLLVAAWHDPS